jgi:hypothetical protein
MAVRPSARTKSPLELLEAATRRATSGKLSATETADLVDVLIRTSLGVSEDVAVELVGVIHAAVATARLPTKVARIPSALITAAELMEEALQRGTFQDRIYQQKMVDADSASQLLGSTSSNLRQYANKQRLDSVLLGVPYKNSYLYPAFQFDVGRKRVIPVVERVNKLLEANKDPWGVASWWTTPSERLNGRCPHELLGSIDEQKIEDLARAELEPIG